MKIAIVSGWLFLPPFCGTRRVVYNTASGLAALGNKVLLMAAMQKHTRLEGGNLVFDALRVNEVLFNVYCLVGTLLSKCFPLVWAPLSDLARSKILDFTSSELTEKISSFKPDIILADDLLIAQVALRVARTLGVPFAYRVHHIYSMKHEQHTPFASMVKRQEQSILENADCLIALTREDQEFIRRTYKSETGYAPIPLEAPNSHELGEASPNDDGFVLYVSSYLGEEMCWLKKFANHCPDAKILFVGRGSEATTRFPKNVIRLGIVSDDKLALLYRKCRLILFPLDWTPGQGFPIKLGEAFRSNKPILVNSKASWLLPESPGLFTFADEDELYRVGEDLLHEARQFSRDGAFFDISSASRLLESELAESSKVRHQ